jgi:hypothetical protein
MRDYIDHALHDAGRLELRHQTGDRWVSGLFDDADALRAEIRRRADNGNLFLTLNAPNRDVPAGNAMIGNALTDADMQFHVRLPIDFDPVRPRGLPSTDAELHAAEAARDRLVVALSASGWPRPAIAMSGNGAHALYRWRMPVSSESVEMLTTLYRALRPEFSTEAADFDPSVRNAARIWRLYGYVNRKGDPTHNRPHRRAHIAIPARWEAVSPRQVERLANWYARCAKVALVPRPDETHIRVAGAGDYRTLDAVSWFKSHDAYRRPLHGDKHAVRCPWEGEHSTDDDASSTATVIWNASDGKWPAFRCLHAHCDRRGIRDVLAAWGDADRFCAAVWRASA